MAVKRIMPLVALKSTEDHVLCMYVTTMRQSGTREGTQVETIEADFNDLLILESL